MNRSEGVLAVLGLGAMFVILTVLCAGCKLGGIGLGLFERQVNPDAIVGNYEWYEQQVKDVKATEGKIRDAEDAVKGFKADNGDVKDYKFDQRQELSRLQSNLTGLKQARRGMVEDYNARAGMVSRNAWKRSDLPQHIEE